MRDIPILFEDKAKCTGCAACFNACTSGAIRMIEDNEGFEYPEIDEKLCIRCMRCIKAAPCQSK